MDLLNDFKPGPLDVYRKQATFCWKRLMLLVEGEDVIELKMKYWRMFEQRPLFQHVPCASLDEERRLATLRIYEMERFGFTPTELMIEKPYLGFAKAIALFQYCGSVAIKAGLSFEMFQNSLISLGDDSHMPMYFSVSEGEVSGSFALTEFGHGTDTKAMRTTATFDPDKQEFILNSSDFEAAKCWSGSLGKSSTHSIIWAKLILPNGTDQGLHPFVVPIRDMETGSPYPGIIVGDMGAKIGLNGVDNGFVLFKSYRIPKSSLLNKTGDVSPDGKYISPYKNQKSRSGATFAVLSGGRVTIVHICISYLSKAIIIAVRYTAVRKQFGPSPNIELPVLEYQLMQWRLFPYLSATFCIKIFGNWFAKIYGKIMINRILKNDSIDLTGLGPEIHALSCAGKPLAGWIARDGIQECREACGGHGYLKAAGIGDARNDNDANCTYEGDNNVLIQQTSNWLLSLWTKKIENNSYSVFDYPLKSVDFLANEQNIRRSRFTAQTVESVQDPKTILDAYKWLTCYLLDATWRRLDSLKQNNIDSFTAKNETQVFYARTLSIVYIEHFIIQKSVEFAEVDAAHAPELKLVILQLTSLYGLWSLYKHMAILYQGGYMYGELPSFLVQEGILNLCKTLKPNAVSLVDAIAPTDFVLNSVLGNSDGEVYKHLEERLFNDPYTFKIPEWWNEVREYAKAMPSKL